MVEGAVYHVDTSKNVSVMFSVDMLDNQQHTDESVCSSSSSILGHAKHQSSYPHQGASTRGEYSRLPSGPIGGEEPGLDAFYHGH